MSAAVQASPLNRLMANLEELGLEGMAPSVPEYVRLVADGRKDLVTALLELTDAQVARKRRADDDRRVRMANFPYIKTLADFDWGFQPSVPRGTIEQLATLSFLESGDNVIFVGSPGVGKSHLSIALGYEAVLAHRQVYFADCSRLVGDLVHAYAKGDPFPKAAVLRALQPAHHRRARVPRHREGGGRPAVPAREQEVRARPLDHSHHERAGGKVGRRLRKQRDGERDRGPPVPPLHARQDNRQVVQAEGRADRRGRRKGGRELTRSGESALARTVDARWRNRCENVGGIGEKYIDTNIPLHLRPAGRALHGLHGGPPADGF